MIDKNIIEKNFSRYAECYDEYSSIQNMCASELISRVIIDNAARILEAGCGTGNYTKLLKDKFPNARIKAVDISGTMLEVAKRKLPDRNIEFITADAERIDFEERFDLISSNAAYQWFEDLKNTLLRYKDMLNEGGLISFSIFGPLTFCELNASLKESIGRDISIKSSSFLSRRKLVNLLKNHFRGVEVKEKIYREKYSALPELIRKIKCTGARGSGLERDNFWTPGEMRNLEHIYKEKFKDITATYQVFFCRGIK